MAGPWEVVTICDGHIAWIIALYSVTSEVQNTVLNASSICDEEHVIFLL